MVTAFKELNDWDEFWARYGQEADDGGRREKCSWTALKANIKKHRSMLDARDVDRAKARYVTELAGSLCHVSKLAD